MDANGPDIPISEEKMCKGAPAELLLTYGDCRVDGNRRM
jgi:hypothetical protein